MRVLILGSTGFVGRHSSVELVSRGHEVVGFGRTPIGASHREVSVDLSDAQALARLPTTLARRFDAAVLLAGVAVPGPRFDERAAAINVGIARHALAWLAEHSPGARVIVMSSAHVYGAQGDDKPLVEARALSPNGPYGHSKLAVERIAHESARQLSIVIVRSFNQIGRAMPDGLLVPDLIEALTHGAGPVVMKGADGVRDFLDVREGARALADLVAADVESGSVFNLCSGRGVALSTLAAGLARALGVEREVHFPTENPLPFVGSRAALARAIRFEPQIPLAETLAWIASEKREKRL
ncbi:MAG: NAD(P)-dependent oxidoreductase [Planctomycetota bacterium]|nr:NAD(P)-dependent oxidoreductase [Planctomycetota bacterium]